MIIFLNLIINKLNLSWNQIINNLLNMRNSLINLNNIKLLMQLINNNIKIDS